MNNLLKNLSWLSLALALCALPVYGCGDDSGDDDDNGGSNADDGGAGKGGAGKDADKDGGAGKGGAGKGGAGTGGDKDGGAGKGGDAGPDAGTGDEDCYAGKEKTTDEQFLNQCSDSQSEKFDNAERIKFELPNGELWKPGDDLPEVP
jgi:hypothetical protein